MRKPLLIGFTTLILICIGYLYLCFIGIELTTDRSDIDTLVVDYFHKLSFHDIDGVYQLMLPTEKGGSISRSDIEIYVKYHSSQLETIEILTIRYFPKPFGPRYRTDVLLYLDPAKQSYETAYVYLWHLDNHWYIDNVSYIVPLKEM